MSGIGEALDDYEAAHRREPPERQRKPRANGADHEPQRGTIYGRLIVFQTADLDSAKPRGYILKGLISSGEISLWAGPPKCGKSFLMLYASYMLSLGRRVFRRRVRKVRVLYIAAEGEGGITNRIKALRLRHGDAPDFHFITQPADLLNKRAGYVDDLLDAIYAIKPDLIVVDTLSRVMAGGDENSPVDMGTFVANMSALCHQTGAHIAIVHHGTQSTGGTKPRGHGSLIGAVDVLIEVTKQDNGDRVISLIFSKDDADGMRWGFDLEGVELGVDDDGDKITTLIVAEREEAPPRPIHGSAGGLTKSMAVALAALRSAVDDQPVFVTTGDDPAEMRAAKVEDWRAVYYRQTGPDMKQDAKQKAFRRAVCDLEARGRIKCLDDLVWAVGDG